MPKAADYDITVEMILEKYEYLKDAGKFSRRKTGWVAGQGRCGHGYIRLVLHNKRTIAAHRAVWLIETGSLPPHGYVIDHINRDMKDNRICNLRVVTHRENIMLVVNEDRDFWVSRGREIAEWAKTLNHKGNIR